MIINKMQQTEAYQIFDQKLSYYKLQMQKERVGELLIRELAINQLLDEKGY